MRRRHLSLERGFIFIVFFRHHASQLALLLLLVLRSSLLSLILNLLHLLHRKHIRVKICSLQPSPLAPTRLIVVFFAAPIRAVLSKRVVREGQPCVPPGVAVSHGEFIERQPALGAFPEMRGQRDTFAVFAWLAELDAWEGVGSGRGS